MNKKDVIEFIDKNFGDEETLIFGVWSKEFFDTLHGSPYEDRIDELSNEDWDELVYDTDKNIDWGDINRQICDALTVKDKEVTLEALTGQQQMLLDKIRSLEQEIDLYEEDDMSSEEEELEGYRSELNNINDKINTLE